MKHYIKDVYSKKLVPIIAMYESYNGWYWFITEDNEEPYEADNGEFGRRLFGLVFGHDIEWGYIWSYDLEKPQAQVWQVPEINWSSNSRVVTLDDDVNPNSKEVKSKIEWQYE